MSLQSLKEKIRAHLVDDANKLHKMWSTYAIVVLVALSQAYDQIAYVKGAFDAISPSLYTNVVSTLGVAIFVLKIIKQQNTQA